jgi:hypothetical protein
MCTFCGVRALVGTTCTIISTEHIFLEILIFIQLFFLSADVRVSIKYYLYVVTILNQSYGLKYYNRR